MDAQQGAGAQKAGSRLMQVGYEAAKAFAMGGISYAQGDPVDTSKLPAPKVARLLDQRYIRPRL